MWWYEQMTTLELERMAFWGSAHAQAELDRRARMQVTVNSTATCIGPTCPWRKAEAGDVSLLAWPPPMWMDNR